VEFAQGVASGKIGHVGLAESIAMIADALGWTLDTLSEDIEPVIDGAAVRGLHQVAYGLRGGRPAITLDLTIAVGAPNPRDTIIMDSDPPINVTVAGGTHGDVATCAIAVNAIPKILEAPSGLTTAYRLPPIHV
jgi:4-hydroxy-tetrahydrodipicolinate reductase